jgi:hypothetical protein
MFEFKIGQTQSFTLHTKLAADHSPFLEALITGQMREAKEGIAIIDDVDEDTFAHFAEFIYSGNYNSTEPKAVSVKACSEECEEGPYSILSMKADPLSTFSFSTPQRPKKTRKEDPKKVVKIFIEFADIPLPIHTATPFPTIVEAAFPSLEPAVEGSDTKYDVTDVLLCHARVYTLADRFQTQALKDLALCKMHRVLKALIMSDDWYIEDIVSLIEYSYENTAGLQRGKEPLRNILAHYAACDFRRLMQQQGFREYVMKGGPFVCDTCEKVSQRLWTALDNSSPNKTWSTAYFS